MDIKISTHQGIVCSFKMTENNDLKDLKMRIKEHLLLDFREQTLLFGNELMNDDSKKLVNYGMKHESCVKLIINIIKPVFTISVSLQGKQDFDVEVRYEDSLSDVRKKIHKHCKLSPPEQILIHLGVVLEGDNSISSYGVQEKSVVQVLRKLINGMQIFAKTMDGKTVAIEVTKKCSIMDIKKKIQEMIGLAPDEQRLVYQGGILEDDKTVEDYQITEKSVINVVARSSNGMQIFVKTMDGKMIAFEVTKKYSIMDIKKIIQEKTDVCLDKQKLMYNGRILENDKTVKDYQIEERSVINVVARLSNGMQIFAKTMNGMTVTIEVTKKYSIMDIKKKIQERIGLCPDELKLVYQGGILEDDKTVGDYQMTERSVINML